MNPFKQMAVLREIGVDYAQGYGIAQPQRVLIKPAIGVVGEGNVLPV